MAFTLIRGPLASDFYPYPFANVKMLGYLKVCINSVWIAILFVGVAAGANALDKRLQRSKMRSTVAPESISTGRLLLLHQMAQLKEIPGSLVGQNGRDDDVREIVVYGVDADALERSSGPRTPLGSRQAFDRLG